MTGCLLSPGFYVPQLGIILPYVFQTISAVVQCPIVVKEAIMTDFNDLVQEFWRTSSDKDVGASFFAMRRLYEILHRRSDNLEVCFLDLRLQLTYS